MDCKELTRAVRRGDEGAFAHFYDLFSLRLFKYLLVLTKGNEPEAREVLQTVFLKLAHRLEIFDREEALWAWLCRLTRNAFIDHYRQRRRAMRVLVFQEISPALPEAEQAEHRLGAGLEKILDELAPEERELMNAVYVDGRSLQEMADETGGTYKSVESRLGRLRQKIKIRLLSHLRHENST